MKIRKTILTAALAGLFAVASTAPAPAAPAQAAATASPTLDNLDPAVRNYLLTAISKSFETLAAASSSDPIAIIGKVQESVNAIPTDSLPTEYREYLKAIRPISDKLAEEAKAQGAMDPRKLAELTAKYKPEMEAAGAKYPNAAAVLGPDNQEALTKAIVQELGIQQMAMQYILSNQTAMQGKSQDEVMSAMFAYMAQEITKLIK